MTLEKCKHVLEEKQRSNEIHIKYLTIELSKILEKDYKTQFLGALRSQVCCEKARLPFLIILFQDGQSTTTTKKGQDSISLDDVSEQLDICFEVTEKRREYCATAKK